MSLRDYGTARRGDPAHLTVGNPLRTSNRGYILPDAEGFAQHGQPSTAPPYGDYSLVMPRPMGVWPAFKVQSSHFPGRASVPNPAQAAGPARQKLGSDPGLFHLQSFHQGGFVLPGRAVLGLAEHSHSG